MIILIILLKCCLQHITQQCSINNTTLQVLMALEHQDHSQPKKVIRAFVMEIREASV